LSSYRTWPLRNSCGATVFRAATPGALAAQIGVDPQVLTETVETYNRAVSEDQGETLTIPRTGSPAPLDANALMAVAMAVGITNTMGGIVTDAQMRVQRRGGGHIGALYAAGGTTGGLEGGGTIGYVGGLIKALVTGLLAGESMA
jgi:fumarate reductase flavoprotein subunit